MFSKLKGNTFLAGSAVYLASNILNAAIPFALLPVLTRYLSPEEYGQVAMFQTLLGALTAFIGLSLHGAAGRKFYDGNLAANDLKEFIGSCLQILLVTTLIMLSILFVFSGEFGQWLGLDTKWVLLAGLTTAATIIAQIRLGQWQVRKKAKSYGALQISKSLLNVGLSLLLVVVFLQGSDGRILAQIVAAGSFGLLALWLLKRDDLLKFFVWRADYIREALRFGVPLIPHVGGVFLLTTVDRFVISAELGLAEAGIYMVAVQFGMAISLVFDAINKAYVPWLFERLKRDDEAEKRQIVRYTYAWFCFILLGAGVGFLVGPWLILFVAGADYARAGDVIGWLILGHVFSGMYLMVTNYIFFSKRTGLLSVASVLAGLVNFFLLLVLVRHLGLEGAAYAFCFSMALRFLLSWYVAQKRHSMPWFALRN
ncbi:polysaccharide biosynthesis protein [Kineobactrum sediminis]|uniref:Polysaccharide biosynthesis protein n=1 Tax=Kineobactrum sediminis TaxID=1905677 RepID=A0A2N5Y127_9GAMM|nr:oligosaccharide flippase family protein [Kineobactrum sediminis]PLW82093.1 polysaccharide biosynthesis protein [Kineobactrum sediminis]